MTGVPEDFLHDVALARNVSNTACVWLCQSLSNLCSDTVFAYGISN